MQKLLFNIKKLEVWYNENYRLMLMRTKIAAIATYVRNHVSSITFMGRMEGVEIKKVKAF